MTHYWDTLLEEQRGPFFVRLSKTWEDLSPHDLFDSSVDDIDEICRRIDRCELDWFMLRAQVFYDGIELGTDYCGGFLYEDAREVIKDGTGEDIISQAIDEAVKEAHRLKAKLAELDLDSMTV